MIGFNLFNGLKRESPKVRKYLANYRNSELKKNLITLGFGTTLAQILPLIFYPILSRLYTPEDFGLLATIMSVTAVLAVIGSGKYESAILIVKTKQDAANVAAMSIGLSFIIGLLLLLILYFFNGAICTWLKEPRLSGWLYICPLLAFLIVVYNTFNEWCVKNSMFRSLAVNKISNSIFLTISKLSFGIGSIKFGLNYGELVGRGFSAGGSIYRAIIRDRDTFKQIKLSECKRLCLENIRFPKYTVPDQLLNNLAGVVPIFSISAYFGANTLGQFSIMTSVLAVPMLFIGQAVKDVFRQRATQDFEENGNCYAIFTKFLKRLSLAAFIGLVAVFFLLPSLFSLVLGEQWVEAGRFAQIMIPSMAIGFVFNVLSVVWLIVGKNKHIMYWQLYYLCCFLLAYSLGIYFWGSITWCLILSSIFVSSAYLIAIYYAYKFSKGFPSKN